MLSWTNRFSIFCFLDNHSYSISPQRFETVLAAGARHIIHAGSLRDLDAFIHQHNNWLFGHLSYELKDQIYGSDNGKQNRIQFPPFCFFVPEILLLLDDNGLTIDAPDPDEVYRQITGTQGSEPPVEHEVQLQQKLTREQYIAKILSLQQHILRGDCYEINFCQEFFADDAIIDPVQVYEQLAALSPNPFSSLYRLNDDFLICASPERFLTKQGSSIYSQPIKGTAKRGQLRQEDEELKSELKNSAKDQAENVMVVDMVRNDLTRICKDTSVKVDELFGIYSFPQVHQMISTISGELKDNIEFSDIIKATFPMGSMTGAPKIRVMELIDQYEVSARGIFSGSVGYMDPRGNFDLNVVIRSIMYNHNNRYLSYQLGSGITYYSDPEKEWEECLLKGEAIRNVLSAR